MYELKMPCLYLEEWTQPLNEVIKYFINIDDKFDEC